MTDWTATITITHLGHEYTRKVPEGIDYCEAVCDAIEDLLAMIYRDKGVKLKIVDENDE